MAIYGATKAFLHSLTQAMQYETNGTSVRVFELIPGGTKTNFQKNAGVVTKNQKLLSADKVVEKCMRLLNKGKNHLVVGYNNKLLTILIKLVPTKIKMITWNYLLSNSD